MQIVAALIDAKIHALPYLAFDNWFHLFLLLFKR